MKVFDIKQANIKEVFIYTDYANILNNLQSVAKIPEYDRFKFVPAYGGNSEILILDNLCKHGFKTYYRMDVMPIKFAELAVKELAKFHALGFIVERKVPEYFEKQIRTQKSSYNFDEDWSEFVNKLCKYIAKDIDRAPTSLENYGPILKEKCINYMTKPGNSKKCLSHSDFRMNNVLVKEMDGVPVEIAVIDYQFLDYGSPVRDLVYFFYMSSDREFRQKHAADLKNIYHDTMSSFLDYFNMDIEDIYPREEFEKDYADLREFGLNYALFLTPFVFAPEDEKFDTSTTALSEVDFSKLDIRYKHRAQGLIDEFVELGHM